MNDSEFNTWLSQFLMEVAEAQKRAADIDRILMSI